MPQLTHFLALPLVNPSSKQQLIQSLAHLHSTISSHREADTLTKALRPLHTLHFTLAVMSLSQVQLSSAVALLQELKPSELLKRNNLKIELVGMKPLQSRTTTSVLYAYPFEDGEVRSFAEDVLKIFREKGFVDPVGQEEAKEERRKLEGGGESEPDGKAGGGSAVGAKPQRKSKRKSKDLLLHATLLNTIYAKSNRGKGRKGPLKFDATPFVEKFGDQVWAKDVLLDKLVICEMGAKEDESGVVRYKEVGALQLFPDQK
ncbi:hypothetical protein K470DRAFT_259918 [Piedraia hortae CBS 480.64]|uniref:A-kinase anchor protein 7-like phosphoesterase domain-containing protein n=1 Tax=Piedraia hortae CBS 480.64 TaxID=1314780 RepID=A0A6A7BSM7_9PEZI|nr:hypothetical protein K470DRAFT_259918 [Piedraia hortae CBS 480.64]